MDCAAALFLLEAALLLELETASESGHTMADTMGVIVMGRLWRAS